ncbi:helix-turn-helix domain-containing protein [Streptomyces sp. NPDC001340]
MRQAVLDHDPCDLGLAGQLWTRAGVRDLIAKLYRERLTEQGVGKALRRWGLSFQRPDKRAVEQDAEAVRVWREQTWPAIRARAKAEGGEMLFADQVGIRSDQVTGRTWGAKGCIPTVRRTGNRFSVNAMSRSARRAGRTSWCSPRPSTPTSCAASCRPVASPRPRLRRRALALLRSVRHGPRSRLRSLGPGPPAPVHVVRRCPGQPP